MAQGTCVPEGWPRVGAKGGSSNGPHCGPCASKDSPRQAGGVFIFPFHKWEVKTQGESNSLRFPLHGSLWVLVGLVMK